MEITLKTKFIIDDKFWEDNYMSNPKIFKNSIQNYFDCDYNDDYVEAVSLDEIEIVDDGNRDS